MIKLAQVLILLLIFEFNNCQKIKFCNPVTSNINPDELPRLPDEFETRVELNSVNENLNSEVKILYDRNEKRADVTIRDQSNTFRRIYDFEHDQIFTIINKECKAKKISESTEENFFFGLIQDQSGINMKPPNFLLHFNNDFPHEKLAQTTYRGIPVNHFKSCQEWPEAKASLEIDYYFTMPGYNPAVSFFGEIFKELPVASIVKGYVDINEVNQTKREINHEYNFFEFRPIVQRKSELFNLPRGIYCDGQLYKEQIPSVPESFSYITETINIKAKAASSERIFYSNFLKTFRLDIVNGLNIDGVNVREPIKIIHDYNSGVAYVVNKNRGNCTFYPLGTIQLDNLDETHLSNGFYTLKKPEEFLKLDDTYVYAGERYERGLLCDVFVSKRNDIVGSSEVIAELYFLKTQIYADQSTDKLEKVVPISYHLTGQNFTLISHAFDFDSQLNVKDFDVSQCFQGKRRINFGIQFGYPDGVDEESFTKFYGRLLEEEFDLKIFKSFKFYSASPLRIARPRFEPRRRGFTVYSAITDHADSINHFIKNGKSKVDLQKIKHGVQANSPETCAEICLSDSQYNLPLDYKCMSFDLCMQPAGGFICSFYNYSLSTDPAVVSDNMPECDHYSKITEWYDSASKEALFRMIEESVVRKELYLDVKDDKGNPVLTFSAFDIFQATESFGQSGSSGQTSFIKQFILAAGNIDFNETTVLNNEQLIFRKNNGTSWDECARNCVREPAFECQIYTYSKDTRECKWSSIGELFDIQDPSKMYFIEKEGVEIFIKDPLYNYIKYPSKVTSVVDYSVQDASTESECAIRCNKEKSLKCRSFNFCSSDDGKSYRCLLSETNIHNLDKDPNVVTTSLCSHFSKRALNDFLLISHTQLDVEPQTRLSRTNVESCAEICSYDDTFFCRSFDFDTETNTCYLYKENLVDKYTIKLGIKTNQKFNHYSRQYYEKDGALKNIEPLDKSSGIGAGTILGILIVIIIGGTFFGILIAFIYLKLSNKNDLLPVMKFVNPNYSKQVDE